MWFQTHSWITENLSFLNWIRVKDTTMLKPYLLTELQPYDLMVSRCNMQSLQNTNYPYLSSSLTSYSSNYDSWQTTLEILWFCLDKPLSFYSPVENNSTASWACVSLAIGPSLAQINLFSIPVIDSLLITVIGIVQCVSHPSSDASVNFSW